jgi:predicted  nucleic acid-binding Zn-ribbon protein
MEHYSNVVKAMIARSNARAADIADKIQARAYYQFQYVPPAGPLPGWSMEQQTEDAINEIGNIAYSSDEIAREAREIAQQAYNAAQAAIEMATNALTAAQNAQQTADTALNTANTAVTKADNAQASADAAQKAADAAQKSANDAQTAADNAQSTADTAIENASQALSAANEAKASADQSNQRLDVLEPIVDTLRWYENVTDNIDFNTRVELERAFLQGTANTNGPIPGPGWLDVDDDYNETYIRQKFIAQADGACYVRFGTIVPDSSPIEVSSWTGWVKYALASELTSAVETINTSITSINGEITTIKSDITSIESDITELQGSLGSAEGDITAVTNALDAHKADYDNPHKVTAAQLGLATVYKYKGSVETYADLPTSGQQVGDVYNVKQADPDHNIEAGDNVAWDGTTWDILAGDTDLSGYAQLNSANTYTALNLFRANIGVSNGTAAGSSGSVSFGVSPTGETVQARIGTDTLGGLFYNTSTNQPHVFRIGNNINSFVIRDNGTMMTFSNNNKIFANVIDASGVANWLGNANTATKLATARTINGVPFDGTQNITIEAGQGTFLPLTGGTVTGPIYLPSDTPTTDTQAVTKKYVDEAVDDAKKTLISSQIKCGMTNLTFTASAAAASISVFAVSNFNQNDDWSQSGANTVTVKVNGNTVGTLSMSWSTTKAGSKGHYWGNTHSSAAANTWTYSIAQGATIELTSSGGTKFSSCALQVTLGN